MSGNWKVTYVPTGEITEQGERIFGVAQCGCDDSLNPNLSVTGTDFSCYCKPGHQWSATLKACLQYIDRYHDKPLTCEAGAGMSSRPLLGNPIDPLSGTKREAVTIGALHSLPLSIVYDTRPKLPGNAPAMQYAPGASASFGALWHSTLHRRLVIQSGPVASIQASRGGGQWVSFANTGAGYLADSDVADRVTAFSAGFRYHDAQTRSQETYSSSGVLQSIKRPDGGEYSFTYSNANTSPTIAPAPGLLIAVTDHQGRAIALKYAQPAGAAAARISEVTAPGGKVTRFDYDPAGNLRLITWPDLTTREFLYENTALPWALTGIRNEEQVRIGTYVYDAQGRAVGTFGAGGVNGYSVSYTAGPAWHVTETLDPTHSIIWRDHWLLNPEGIEVTGPDGQPIPMQSVAVQGSARLTSQSQPAGAGCGPASRSQTFDLNANVTSRNDFNGQRTCFGYDTARNLQTARVEGLDAAAQCSGVLPGGSSLPAGARKISTQWHPQQRLQTKLAAPLLLTTTVYNGQPDPFNGGAPASCAGGAFLPDGQPLAVACKVVEQATTDANGSQGFAAAPDPAVAMRVHSYTYNQRGQVLTAKDPLNNTTTSSYYGASGADHAAGDLQQVRNARGQLTQYTKYNAQGQLLRSIDPNGIVSHFAYDDRQRLRSTEVAGLVLTYEYWPAGQLRKVIQPDGSFVSYEYDAAQRLKAVADNSGNRIEYTLDNKGNRTAERVKDSSGALRREIGRVFDALGRLQQLTGRE